MLLFSTFYLARSRVSGTNEEDAVIGSLLLYNIKQPLI